MQSISQIVFMIFLLLSGIGYTLYNYTHGKISEMMMILFVGVLGASLLNMVRGLIRAIKDK